MIYILAAFVAGSLCGIVLAVALAEPGKPKIPTEVKALIDEAEIAAADDCAP